MWSDFDYIFTLSLKFFQSKIKYWFFRTFGVFIDLPSNFSNYYLLLVLH